MSLELRFAAAQRKQHRKRQQLARPGIQPAAGDVITETIHRQVILYVFLALGGRFAQGVDMSCAENGLLDGQSPFEPRPRRGRRLSFERKRHAARHQHIVGDMYEIVRNSDCPCAAIHDARMHIIRVGVSRSP